MLNNRDKLVNDLMISIVICSRGRSSDLRDTLASLSKVEIPLDFRTELLIVENGTKEDAEGLTASFRHQKISARYLFEPAPGKSRALNRAIKYSNGAILLFTDDDIRFPINWVTRMCRPIIEGDADAVAGAVRLAPHLLRPWMTRMHRAWLASTDDYLLPAAPSEMCGANMSIRRQVLDQLGGFDLELGPGISSGGEESLLSWQAKRAGFRIVSAFDVCVEHHLDRHRLLYKSWTRAAHLRGKTNAYLMHHWLHKTFRFPWAKQQFCRMKLFLRKTYTRRWRSDEEGITSWELSYIEEISKYAYFMAERRRPRNYSIHGICKIEGDGNPLKST